MADRSIWAESWEPGRIDSLSDDPRVRVILEAFPHLDPDDRHLIIDRMCGDTWEELVVNYRQSENTLRKRYHDIVLEIKGFIGRV